MWDDWPMALPTMPCGRETPNWQIHRHSHSIDIELEFRQVRFGLGVNVLKKVRRHHKTHNVVTTIYTY